MKTQMITEEGRERTMPILVNTSQSPNTALTQHRASLHSPDLFPSNPMSEYLHSEGTALFSPPQSAPIMELVVLFSNPYCTVSLCAP